jgi:hypothetical protein
MSVLPQPILHSVEKLPATLPSGKPDQCEFPIAVRTTNVFEPEEFKRFRFPSSRCKPFFRESPEHYAARFLFGEFNEELAESRSEPDSEFVCVFLVLKARYKIVNVADEIGGSATDFLYAFLKP